MTDIVERLREQLAAAQAREAKLREALAWVNSRWADVSTLALVREAISLPSDDSALHELLAAERTRCAAIARRLNAPAVAGAIEGGES